MDNVPRWLWRAALPAALLFWAAGAAWSTLARLGPVVALVVVSFFVAAALEVPVNALVARGLRRGAAVAVMLAGLAAAAGGIVAVLGVTALSQARSLRDALPAKAGELDRFFAGRGLDTDVAGALERFRPGGFDTALSWGGHALVVTGWLLAGLFVVFYLVADGPRIRRAVCSLVAPHRQGEVLRIWEIAVAKTGGYLAAKAVIALVSAVVHSALFAAVGVPYPVAMGIWAGLISQAIPVIGTYLAIAVPALLVLSAGGVAPIVAVLIGAVIYGQVENLLLAPRLTAHTTDVHPLAGFLAVIAVAVCFGPAASLLAVPALATVSGFAAAYLERHDVVDDPRL